MAEKWSERERRKFLAISRIVDRFTFVLFQGQKEKVKKDQKKAKAKRN